VSETASILVVDDEASIRFFLSETLDRDGYQVTTAQDGYEALEQLQQQRFDLVLLDLRMPGLNGMQVLEKLREQSPDTAVIVLTAHASLETAVQALRQGAHDYLSKPIKTVELRESVRSGLIKHRRQRRQRDLVTQLETMLTSNLEEIRAMVLAELATSQAALEQPSTEQHQRFLQWDDLTIDSVRHIATLQNEVLELSPTEFNLLAYLVDEAPRVVPAEELVREVQGYDSPTVDAGETVRYHVYRLRQKIKAATGRADLIRTVRGVGYTLHSAANTTAT
jgi:DNA-binding response OmpR family regulator